MKLLIQEAGAEALAFLFFSEKFIHFSLIDCPPLLYFLSQTDILGTFYYHNLHRRNQVCLGNKELTFTM